VTVLGGLLLLIGVVLLPLPGPGWLIIFAGLGVLATEYPWAERLLASVKKVEARWRTWLRRRNKAIRILIAVVALVVLAAILLGCWYLAKVI
jgi:uncharacterized protein (TIGR02611 family)